MWVGIVTAAMISLIHFIPCEYLLRYLPLGLLTILAILFMHVVFTDMKINAADIAVTLFGIIYIVGLFAYVALLNGYERNGFILGKLFLGYLFLATWGCDVFAFLIGFKFGKHKFSKISPNKTIEGCIGGIFGAVIFGVGLAFFFNITFHMNFSYITILLIEIVLSVVGQIGDFAASSIKRHVGIKDFSNLIPGHGGMLDRLDSVIFIAPFAYMLLRLL